MSSSVRTIIPPGATNLISLAQVKTYLQDPTVPDSVLSPLIVDASSAMVRFIGVEIARQKYEEKSSGTGSSLRYLSRLPVEPGTLSITLDGIALVEYNDDPSTYDMTQYTLDDPSIGSVSRQIGWRSNVPLFGRNLIDTYYAGFLLPDQISTWTISSARTLGSWARPTYPSLLCFECTSAGTSALSEPAWPSTIGATISDGSIIWTARAAIELPSVVSQWCYIEVLSLLSDLGWEPGLISRTVEGVSESRFARKQDDGTLAPKTMSGLIAWKRELGLVGVA